MKLKGKPFDIVVIQLYAPTQDHPDGEIEDFYEKIRTTIKQVKSDDVIIVMGDMNAKVGNEQHSNIVGKFGLGSKNETGMRLIQFCEENNLILTNTWYQHPARKLYTWKSPGDVRRNQIDYIMINQTFRKAIRQVKTYPGADINSDHNQYVK